MSRQKKADLLLILNTGFWGCSYYLSDLALEEMPPLALCAFRFLTAFCLLGVILFPKLRRPSRGTMLWAIPAGLALTLTYIGATVGLLYTSISNAGFICALPVVTTPILTFLVYHKKPERRMLIAMVVCALGLALLTLNDQLRLAPGDLICLLCALGYAINLLVVERAVRQPEVDALQLGVFQQAVTGAAMLLLSALFEQPRLPDSAAGWGSALFLAVFCTGIAFAVTAVQQQYTSASHVGLIFTLEPVFSAIVAYIFAHEVLSVRGYIGAGLMMLSLFWMEGDWSALRTTFARWKHRRRCRE